MPMPIEYVHGMACKRCGIQMTCHWFRNLRTLKNGKCKQNYKTNTKVQSKSKNTRISRRKTNWTQEVSMLAFNRRICLRSIMMTVAIALERYVAVHYPINYSQESHLQCYINKKLRTVEMFSSGVKFNYGIVALNGRHYWGPPIRRWTTAGSWSVASWSTSSPSWRSPSPWTWPSSSRSSSSSMSLSSTPLMATI